MLLASHNRGVEEYPKLSMNKFIGLLLLVPVLAFGHTELVESTPAADSIISQPERIILRFSQDVLLIKLIVTSETGKELYHLSQRVTQTRPEYNVRVPNMVRGIFTVDWGIIGEDGHPLTDSFTFKVREHNAQDTKREADTFVDAIRL